MIVGSLEIQLALEGCESLKDKRRILRSLMDRLRHEFHVAVAEVDDQELWGNATIGIAAVGNDARHIESVLQHVTQAIDTNCLVSIEGICRSISQPD